MYGISSWIERIVKDYREVNPIIDNIEEIRKSFETQLKNKPHLISTDIQKILKNKKKYFEFYDSIDDEKIGWKISNKNLDRYVTVTLGNFLNEPERIKFFKF